MLDRKIKDWDAGLELLLDRKKTTKIYFFFFFITGWSITVGSAAFLNTIWDDVGFGLGIALLILATWYLMIWLNYAVLIKLEMMKDKEKK